MESDPNHRSTVAGWLSRLSFSFLIVAMIVSWDVRREYVATHVITQQMAANIALVAVCVVLAIVGTACATVGANR